MAGYRRNLVEGGTYFFTVALQDRQADTLVRHVQTLRAAFQQAKVERHFTIDAIVILPDHLHTVMTLPVGDAAFGMRWRRIKTLFTQSLLSSGVESMRRDRTGRILWQRRFWEHTIRDNTDYARHVEYIHFNPVKHGYADHPQDWPYSSLHRYLRQGLAGAEWTKDGQAEELVANERYNDWTAPHCQGAMRATDA